jgi:feruloyl esterase
VRAKMGARADRSMRLFMVPGMEHCNAGPGLNSFGQGAAPYPGADPAKDIGAAMEAWLEHGRAPGQLEAVSAKNWAAAPNDRRIAEVQRTGLLCAYPKISVWDGTGNPDKAASYSCRTE